eukprot:scaffold370998_cov18-Prasinocladus_malaysianus.AAC.1
MFITASGIVIYSESGTIRNMSGCTSNNICHRFKYFIWIERLDRIRGKSSSRFPGGLNGRADSIQSCQNDQMSKHAEGEH